MKKVEAIIIDGWHKGHVLRMEYCPIIKLLKPKEVVVDYCCDPSMEFPKDPEMIEYKECFRAVDHNIVLYSTKGESRDVYGFFTHEVTNKAYRPDTVLKFGFIGENFERIN